MNPMQSKIEQNKGREAFRNDELYDLSKSDDWCLGWLCEKAKGLKGLQS